MPDRNEILRQYYSDDELREYKELRRSLRDSPITKDMNLGEAADQSVIIPVFTFIQMCILQWFTIIGNIVGVEYVQKPPSLMEAVLIPYVMWPLAVIVSIVMVKWLYNDRGLRVYKQYFVQLYRNRAVILIMAITAAIHLGTVIAYSGI